MSRIQFIYYILFLLIFQTGCSSPASNHSAVFINRSQLNTLLLNNQGKYIVLNYWASWCKNCKPDLKKLAGFKNKYKAKPLRIVCIAVDNKDDTGRQSLVNKIYQNSGLTNNIYISAENDPVAIMSVVDNKGSAFVPVTYLLAKNGQQIRTYSGRYAMQYLAMTLNRKLNE